MKKDSVSLRRIYVGGGSVALLLVVGVYIFSLDYSKNIPVLWGATYTPFFASSLGLDPHETYRSMLDDLHIRRVRIGAYWPEIEKKQGTYDFSELDWYVREATARDVKLILAIGERLPRWPECHIPSWASSIHQASRREALLSFMRAVVIHYKDNPTIIRWQIENEPLLNLFGKCPFADRDFLTQEIASVRGWDTRPLMVTDSGELSTWGRTINLTDYFGTTLYTRVWAPYWGYFNEILPAALYNWRARLWGKESDKVVIAELQAEPWLKINDFVTASSAEHVKSFSVRDLHKTLFFARKTGIGEMYLWGVEYWYYMKEKRNDPSFLNEIQSTVNAQ